MNSQDRCDAPACSAQAQVRVRIETTLHELQFCGHHTNKYSDALDAQGFYTVATSKEGAGV